MNGESMDYTSLLTMLSELNEIIEQLEPYRKDEDINKYVAPSLIQTKNNLGLILDRRLRRDSSTG
jgi:hypothetical protein